MTGFCRTAHLFTLRGGEIAFVGSEDKREYWGLPSREKLRTADMVCWLRRFTLLSGLLSMLSSFPSRILGRLEPGGCGRVKERYRRHVEAEDKEEEEDD